MKVFLSCLAGAAALSLACSDAPTQTSGSITIQKASTQTSPAKERVSAAARNARAIASRTADPKVPEGQWGGSQVNLVVTASGGAIEFSCAHGSIDQVLLLDSSGHFDAAGTFVQEGGPTPIQENRVPARYSGSTDGKTMTLTITVSKGQKIGPIQLVLGGKGRLFKCL